MLTMQWQKHYIDVYVAEWVTSLFGSPSSVTFIQSQSTIFLELIKIVIVIEFPNYELGKIPIEIIVQILYENLTQQVFYSTMLMME